MGSLKKIRQFGSAVWQAIYSFFCLFFKYVFLAYVTHGTQGFHKECQPIGQL